MISNEVTDLFFIPLGKSLAAQIWDVLLETKIYTIPFSLYIWKCVNEARGAGSDEGSPPIQAFRKYESKLWAMLIIMLFTCQPISGSVTNSDVAIVNDYTCTAGGMGLAGLTPKNFAGTSVINDIEPANPTLWNGLINTFAAGMTNASIASIGCSKEDESYRAAYTKIAEAKTESKELAQLINDYNSQCYNKAMVRKNEQEFKTGDHLNKVTFNGEDIRDAFQGYNSSQEEMYANVKASHFGGSDGWFDKAARASCADIGTYIQDQLTHEVETGKHKEDFKRVSVSSVNPTNDAVENQDEQNVNLLYENTNSPRETTGQTFRFLANAGGAADIGIEAAKGNIHSVSDGLNAVGASARYAAGNAGNLLAAATESLKVLQYQVTAPIVIGIAKMILVIAVPVMMFFSGFSGSMLLTISIGYFAFDYSKFWFELGAFLDEKLSMFMQYASAFGDKDHSQGALMFSASTMTLLSYIVAYSLPILWYMFCGWLGVKMVGALGMADSHSSSATSATSTLTSAAVSGAVGGTKAAIAATKG
ncbi:conjugal transfer protein TraG [Vibrio sp. S11_S32]|uniref:conjugal transfer protein TraG N-terminal domain-containing protein n=1 Tax=Vibrio sp. S11_S32 TaxID=2720225 RepID=UPI0016807F01|nr:conjugal transfer protein TraG N-terminal domain-containing protein [Vibrio sp. S11_S32]MBD1577116.1 conjugal transfer protein TraG [Vibrio sp. S11_S32]